MMVLIFCFVLAQLLIIPSCKGFVVVSPSLVQARREPIYRDFHPTVELRSVRECTYDLAVVGAGVVGVQAAMAAAQRNQSVAIIDAPSASGSLSSDGQDLSLGGPTGLFSKALRDTSKKISVTSLRGMGLREDSVWNEIIGCCLDLAASNSEDIERQLDMAGVDLITGFGQFIDKTTRLEVKTEQEEEANAIVSAGKILLATGSKPFRPQGIPFDGRRIFDSDSINNLSYLPKSVAITGSGIIAVEFAKIFRNLGADVTLLIRDQIPRTALMKMGLDTDVAATLVADLIRSGIKIERGCQVAEFFVPNGLQTPIRIELQAKGGGPRAAGLPTEVQCDAYLAAVGREPNTNGLNLEKAGIEIDEYGGILVDAKLKTAADNVYAAGDVLGRPFLASTGMAQGMAAIASMYGSSQLDDQQSCDPDDPSCQVDGISRAGASFDPASLASNPFAFPTGVWTSPEAAYYGLSLQQANDSGIRAGEGIALYSECLRGRVFSPNGLLKLVFDRDGGRVVGVHICGDDACELIHYGMEIVKSRRTVQDINESLYSAVTFHELFKIAAQAAMDEAGARQRRRAIGAALAKRNRRRANVGV